MVRTQIAVPQNSENTVVLFDLSSDGFVKVTKKVIDKPGRLVFRLTSQQALLRIFTLIYRLKVITFAIVVIAIEWHQINIHHRQSRHNKTAQRSDIHWRVNGVEDG